jgi:hypothetical protein
VLLTGVTFALPSAIAPTSAFALLKNENIKNKISKIITAFRDSAILVQESGYPKETGVALGESESHDNNNQMNYHFWNMRYATQGLYWYNFSNTSFYGDWPYYYTKVSDTEWWAKGNP